MARFLALLGTVCCLTVSTLQAAAPLDPPSHFPSGRLSQAAIDALWAALGWLLVLP